MNWVGASRMSVTKSVSENSDDGHKKIARAGVRSSHREHRFLTNIRDLHHSLANGSPCTSDATENKDDPRRLPGPTPTPTEPLPQRRAGHSLSDPQFTSV